MILVDKYLIENIIPVEIYQGNDSKYRVSVNNKMVDEEYATLADAKAYANSFTLLNE